MRAAMSRVRTASVRSSVVARAAAAHVSSWTTWKTRRSLTSYRRNEIHMYIYIYIHVIYVICYVYIYVYKYKYMYMYTYEYKYTKKDLCIHINIHRESFLEITFIGNPSKLSQIIMWPRVLQAASRAQGCFRNASLGRVLISTFDVLAPLGRLVVPLWSSLDFEGVPNSHFFK